MERDVPRIRGAPFSTLSVRHIKLGVGHIKPVSSMRALLYLQLFCLPSPLVSLNLVTMARTRACSKPAGKTKKDLKQQLKAEKQIKKNEKCLEKALSAYQKQGHQTDFDFIIAQLEQTPKWVAPLAQLIRHGAMGVLLKTGSLECSTRNGGHPGSSVENTGRT